ncbi:hypothetical protein JYQ62_32660 [Nostoc sp. UHCC 0702]|nr:hypothetical protein JYQ62_32660 [Nostoc sp. UHCC 0702]
MRQSDLGGFPQEELPKGFPDLRRLASGEPLLLQLARRRGHRDTKLHSEIVGLGAATVYTQVKKTLSTKDLSPVGCVSARVRHRQRFTVRYGR